MIQDVKIVRLYDNAKLPSYGTEFSAGADLCACLSEPVTIQPGETKMISIGISTEIPVGLVALIFARSGLATKRNLAPANKVGVVDSDYRGEWFVPLHNHGATAQTVEPGERIAQTVFVPYVTANFLETDHLSETARGAGGFGSTGTK